MTDRHLQHEVQRALEWEPSIESAAIGVSVDDGVVTLRGEVASYAERHTAERVVLRVFGVKAVANELAIELKGSHRRDDTDLARAAVSALEWNTNVPHDRVTVSVSNGWVTLKGEVDWNYQRIEAFNAVHALTGVRGVTNTIVVTPHVQASDVRARIEAALKRSAEVDARRINVGVSDNKVVLSGHVHSWAERSEVRHAAWSAPGVKEVDDQLKVVP